MHAAIFVYVLGSWNSSWSCLSCSSNTTQTRLCLTINSFPKSRLFANINVLSCLTFRNHAISNNRVMTLTIKRSILKVHLFHHDWDWCWPLCSWNKQLLLSLHDTSDSVTCTSNFGDKTCTSYKCHMTHTWKKSHNTKLQTCRLQVA